MSRIVNCTMAVLLAVSLSTAAFAQGFGAYSHVDELAMQVRNLATNTCWEMHHHYRHHPGFQTTYREAFEMYTVADHIHDLVHNDARKETVQRNVQELDALFHHIEEDLGDWGVYGHTSGHVHDQDHGHAHHSHARLRNLMLELEDSLHHLMKDVGVSTAFSANENGSTPPLPLAH